MSLEQIIAHGNRNFEPRAQSIPNNLTCKDGFTLSVIAGEGAYCSPRPNRYGLKSDAHTVTSDYSGPYTAVEVGYPSERPEPWECSAWHDGHDRHKDHPVCDGWGRYAEVPGSYGESSVYGWMPVEMVRALVASHGGEA